MDETADTMDHDFGEDEDVQRENHQADEDTNQQSGENKKVIDMEEVKKFDQKIDRTGLIYVSRIPPGMGPGKLEHLLSKWGAINRVYLARDEKHDERSQRKKKMKKRENKHQSYQFKEGWVEFEDKKVARRVAEMLNTRPIGGKASDRYYSDLWLLTYLPKFKWSSLSDQMSAERRIKEQLQRNILEDSKKSQDWYLSMVEKSQTNEKIRQKEIKRKGQIVNPDKWQTKNDFKQRELDSSHKKGKEKSKQNDHKLQSVLSNLL